MISTPSPIAEREASPAERTGRLDRSLVKGIAWTGGTKWAAQVVTWAASIVVARLLSPEDYGLVGMATAYLGMITLLGEFGLGAAIVNLRSVEEDELRQLNSLAVLLGLGSCLAGVAAAGVMSDFFSAPQLRIVATVLSLNFVVAGFRVVPAAALQRDLRFRRLALLDGGQALLVAGSMVAAATSGMSYWTLVLGSTLGTLLSTGFMVASRPCGFALPRLAALRGVIGFSKQLLVQRVAWYAFQNSDFVVVGRILGKGALGSYTLGWELANMAVDKVSAMVVRVTPGVFSAVQGDRPALRRYLLSITEGLSLVTFPLCFGLALVADDFVHLALGESWGGTVLPLRILVCYAALRSLTPLLPQILNICGESRFLMYHSLVTAAVLPLCFLIGSRWGTAGVASAWIVGFGAMAVPLYRRVARVTGLCAAEYLAILRPAATASVVMALAVTAAAAALPLPWPPLARLGTEVAAGACGYLCTLVLLHPERLRQHRAVLAMARR